MWVNREVEGGGIYSVVSVTKRYVANNLTTIYLKNCQFFHSE